MFYKSFSFTQTADIKAYIWTLKKYKMKRGGMKAI